MEAKPRLLSFLETLNRRNLASEKMKRKTALFSHPKKTGNRIDKSAEKNPIVKKRLWICVCFEFQAAVIFRRKKKVKKVEVTNISLTAASGDGQVSSFLFVDAVQDPTRHLYGGRGLP